MRRELSVVALAGLLVLAGCSSAVAPGGSGAGTPTDGDVGTTATAAMGATDATGSGTVNFYVSDERNAIGDFEHLNVTVETVSFRPTGDDGAVGEEADTPDPTGTPDPTDTPGNEGEEGSEERTGTSEPADSPEPTDAPEGEADRGESDDGEAQGDDSEGESDDGKGEGDDGEGDAEWVTREVNATTVDLTGLQGENATMLSRFDLPNGTYTQVRLHVAEANGTLTSGGDVRVKLPSERLRLNERFTVGDGDAVDFVFDATVFEAGESGEYILKPVASESGTDVPIKEVARDGGREGRLGARFLGSVAPGEAATVKVTRGGRPVAGATVDVGDRTYETGSDGTVMFDVPADAEELEVEMAAGDAEAELKRTFAGGSREVDDERSNGSDGDERGSPADDGREDGQGSDGTAGGTGPS